MSATPAATRPLFTARGVRIRVSTRFGHLDADLRDAVRFPEGLPGFESCRHFVVASSPELAPLQCLHALDGMPATFLAVDPRLVVARYSLAIGPAERLRLGAGRRQTLLWLALITLTEDDARANLRAPIVINPATMIGCQLMPEGRRHSLRHRLPALRGVSPCS